MNNIRKQALQRRLRQPQRLQTIQIALARLKRKNNRYREQLLLNKCWNKIKNSLEYQNYDSDLDRIMEITLCETDSTYRSYFNPFAPKGQPPIKMCYNKISDTKIFSQQALFNLILYYDTKTKSNCNWNDLQFTSNSYVRAANISGRCKPDQIECFENILKEQVLQKEKFKDLDCNFKQIISKAIKQMDPISQIIFA